MSSFAPPKNTPTVSRHELLFLAGAAVFGAIVRLSFLNRIAVEHFDEGVYASNFWFRAEEGYAYPAQHLYAPPLLPTAIEWTMTLVSLCGFKPTGFVPMIPSLVAGIAMIPSIWWVGRSWFGPSAGIVSAWLVATSDFHASYSRAALTDVPLCLLVLWAVYFFWRTWPDETQPAIERKKSKAIPAVPLPWRNLILAGGFTGLAWSTKYNGWLPLAIGIAGGVLWCVIIKPGSRLVLTTLNRWLIVAAIALLVWSPVLWGLQKHGGYATVAANHRQYLVGLNRWWGTAVEQIKCAGMYDNLIGFMTEPFLIDFRGSGVRWTVEKEPSNAKILSQLTTTLRHANRHWNNPAALAPAVYGLTILLIRLAVVVLPIGLLVVSIGAAVITVRPRYDRRQRMAASLLVAWLLGMSVATPFYHPYPRLVFPWLTAVWLGVGLAAQICLSRTAGTSASGSHFPWRPSLVECVVLVWITSNCLIRLMAGTAHAWSDRTSIAVVSEKFSNRITNLLGSSNAAKEKSIVQVWGEPALVFGLRSRDFVNVFPSQGLDSIDQPLPLPTFVAFGKQSMESSEYAKTRSKLEHCRLAELCRFPASHLVEMDAQNGSNFYAPTLSDKVISSIGRDPVADQRAANDPFSRSHADSAGIWLFRVNTK